MKFSIIVPVYNSEKYIVQCIDSIMKQTYDNWELIIINDGSTDMTKAIIESYYLGDQRVKMYTQNNSGAGIARNNGIIRATGDYIIFIDSDDYIDLNYLKKLYDLISEENLDVILVNLQQVQKDNYLSKREYMSKYKTYSKEKILKLQMTGKIPWGAVRKVVKKDIIKKYSISFSDDLNGEEAIYSFNVIKFADKFGFLDLSPAYYYRVREDSLSRKPVLDPWGPVTRNMENNLRARNMLNVYLETLNSFRLTAFVVSIERIIKYNHFFQIRKLVLVRYQQFKNDFDEEKGIDFQSLDIRVKIIYFLMKVGLLYPSLCIVKLIYLVIDGCK